MLLGDNAHRYGVNQAVPDDCLTLLTTLNSLGHNLIETMDNCALSGTTLGNIIGPDPRLGPLQNNGGSTDTQVPLADSPAIDHGDNAACLPIDQRGWHRPISAHCDIGAVEVGLFG
jgi:hypothetical protein